MKVATNSSDRYYILYDNLFKVRPDDTYDWYSKHGWMTGSCGTWRIRLANQSSSSEASLITEEDAFIHILNK